MKCNICNKKIEKCIYNNYDCKTERHWECREHFTHIGLGCTDPCRTIKIKGNIGYKTIIQQAKIHIVIENWKDIFIAPYVIIKHFLTKLKDK